jgi:hypothetical protein
MHPKEWGAAKMADWQVIPGGVTAPKGYKAGGLRQG